MLPRRVRRTAPLRREMQGHQRCVWRSGEDERARMRSDSRGRGERLQRQRKRAFDAVMQHERAHALRAEVKGGRDNVGLETVQSQGKGRAERGKAHRPRDR